MRGKPKYKEIYQGKWESIALLKSLVKTCEGRRWEIGNGIDMWEMGMYRKEDFGKLVMELICG